MGPPIDPAQLPTPPTGFPAPRPRSRVPLLVIGLIIGLLVGGGTVGLVWGLSGSGEPLGAEADARAVCGIIERSRDFQSFEDLDLAEANRWIGVGTLGESIAEMDGRYRPLADELDTIYKAVTQLNPPELGESIARAREICAEL